MLYKKNIFHVGVVFRQTNSTRLHGFFFSNKAQEKVEEVAEASASLAIGLKKNVDLVAGGTSALLGNATVFVGQVHLGGQSLILGVSAYNAGAALIDFSVCPSYAGKTLYGFSAICSAGSVISTGSSMATGRLLPYHSYTFGVGGVVLRKLAKYSRNMADAQNPLRAL